MKIRARDVGLLIVGFVVGIVIAASLTSPPRTVTVPSSRAVAMAPLLGVASLPPIPDTNFVIELPPMHSVTPSFGDDLDLPIPSPGPGHRSLELIDTRYRPDIRLDDLK